MSNARLIDGFVAEPDARTRHSIHIAASTEEVWHALWTVDLGDVLVVRLLIGLRSLPKLLAGRKHARRRAAQPTLVAMQEAGFGKLGEILERKVVFGVHGRFWSPADNIDPFDEESFGAPVPTGRARAIWDFCVAPRGVASSVLTTETRVVCGDTASRRKFRAYWLVVRPFSGLIRILMLRAIRRAAEGSHR